MFGTRKLVKKLKKRHVTGKRKEELKKEWKEKRRRINTDKGRYIYAKVHRNVQKGRAEKDKWTNFIDNLPVGESA